MLIRTKLEIPSSEITPESTFLNRRRLLTSAATLGAGAIASSLLPAAAFGDEPLKLFPSKYKLPDAETPINKAAGYNNFYEFGVEKNEPAKNAHTLQTRPWTIQIEGMVKKPQTVGIDDLMHYRPLESRVYRHRCVEAWSMVIPWIGYSFSEFVGFCDPLPGAKYVQFISNLNRKQMPDLPSGYNWPYSEGLRMDEAMHPLALLCFGCYNGVLPNQNGAPVRIVLPWKWGYKSAKSIVKVIFTDKQPRTLWNDLMPEEYGFYSNVNPSISHRWSQEHERRIDSALLPHSIPTQMFNGYGDEVASLYNGMDLKKYY